MPPRQVEELTPKKAARSSSTSSAGSLRLAEYTITTSRLSATSPCESVTTADESPSRVWIGWLGEDTSARPPASVSLTVRSSP